MMTDIMYIQYTLPNFLISSSTFLCSLLSCCRISDTANTDTYMYDIHCNITDHTRMHHMSINFEGLNFDRFAHI